MHKKILIAPVIAIVLAGGVFFVTRPVAAQGLEQSHDVLVQRIAQAFGKNESEVQAIFDEVHQERQAERHAQFVTRLETAVEKGDLSEEQKNLIVQKHEEIQDERVLHFDEMKTMTPEERIAHMQAKAQELQQWIEENGIDTQYFNMIHKGKMHGGPRMHRMYKQQDQ